MISSAWPPSDKEAIGGPDHPNTVTLLCDRTLSRTNKATALGVILFSVLASRIRQM